MKSCANCAYLSKNDSKFCGWCGTLLSVVQELPYVGDGAGKGIFRITYAPQEREFRSEDHVRDFLRRSTFGEDGEFKGDVKIQFVLSTVTKETHPFECTDCKNTPNAIVSVTDQGLCQGCGKKNWVRRA